MLLKARFVVPVDAPVIRKGAVRIEADRIVAVGAAAGLSAPSTIDYGDAVIVPGLVNAHTHLDLSLLAGLIPPSPDFPDWLTRLVPARRAQVGTREAVHEAVDLGVGELLRAGVTAIGDITSTPAWTREVLARSRIRSVSFGEVIAIGSRRGQLPTQLDVASDPTTASPRVRIGISPHAPYTVEPHGLRTCADRAARLKLPLCIHLAETSHEEEFTQSASGPLADHLRSLGVWDDSVPSGGCGPVELAERCGLLGDRTLLAHVNYVSDDGIARIARSRSSVAYCPRTHRAFGHPGHRFCDMLAAGINVCLGTDSLASSPSLSILDELRFLRRIAGDVPSARLLEMATLRGARALGFDAVLGSLTPGKLADLVVIPLDGGTGRGSWDSVLESSLGPIAVLVAGKQAYPRADGGQ